MHMSSAVSVDSSSLDEVAQKVFHPIQWIKAAFFAQPAFAKAKWNGSVSINGNNALNEMLRDPDWDTWIDLELYRSFANGKRYAIQMPGLHRVAIPGMDREYGYYLYHFVVRTGVNESRDIPHMATLQALLRHMGVRVLDVIPVLLDKEGCLGGYKANGVELLKTFEYRHYDVAGKLEQFRLDKGPFKGPASCKNPAFESALQDALRWIPKAASIPEKPESKTPDPAPEQRQLRHLLNGHAALKPGGAAAANGLEQDSRLRSIPDSLLPQFSTGHQLQIRAAKAISKGEHDPIQWSDSGKLELQEWLKTWHYPRYLFDLESYSTAIPLWEGCTPNQGIPFQYSLHVMVGSGQEVRTHEFLHEQPTDPRWAFVERLLVEVPLHQPGATGVIGVYSTHEQVTLLALLKSLEQVSSPTEHQQQLLKNYATWCDCVFTGAEPRVRDLMHPFYRSDPTGFKAWLYHAKQGGSASIKAVHPALCGHDPYAGLPIADGRTATAAYLQAIFGEPEPAQRLDVFQNLKRYCNVDTQVMLEILHALEKMGIGNNEGS